MMSWLCRYGNILKRYDYESSIGFLTFKIYEYEKSFYYQVWKNGEMLACEELV